MSRFCPDWRSSLDALAKRNVELQHQVEQLTERRNEAARIIEKKRDERYKMVDALVEWWQLYGEELDSTRRTYLCADPAPMDKLKKIIFGTAPKVKS